MVFKALSKIKIKVDLKPTVDSLVFRLHYRYTNRILLASTLLTTLYDVVGERRKFMVGWMFRSVGGCDESVEWWRGGCDECVEWWRGGRRAREMDAESQESRVWFMDLYIFFKIHPIY